MTAVTADTYQTEPKKTLNLRPGLKQVVQNQKKKVVIPPKKQSNPMLEKNKLRINKRRMWMLKR